MLPRHVGTKRLDNVTSSEIEKFPKYFPGGTSCALAGTTAKISAHSDEFQSFDSWSDVFGIFRFLHVI